MFDWFQPKCPIDPVTKQWIERRWKWLTDEFGVDLMIDSPTILPTPEFFPDEYDASAAAVRTLVDRVCGQDVDSELPPSFSRLACEPCLCADRNTVRKRTG